MIFHFLPKTQTFNAESLQQLTPLGQDYIYRSPDLTKYNRKYIKQK